MRGRCGVRENIDGTLYTLNYGRVAAVNLDPIEKKPLYHFQPGTQTYSFATMGCNLSCSFCQNWSISQPPRVDGTLEGQPRSPEMLVREALRLNASSIAYTYTEPTVFFELMHDTAQLARNNKLKNVMVSNGYMSRKCLDALGPDIDAINVDLKCFTEDFYQDLSGAALAPVLENLRYIRNELKWWLEVTTLLIPGKNDSAHELNALTDFLVSELGPETPWHISRFHPDYKMGRTPATSRDSLDMAYEIGCQKGLKYIYIGNMPGLDRQHTHCPGCGHRVITRSGFGVALTELEHGTCSQCGKKIHGINL